MSFGVEKTNKIEEVKLLTSKVSPVEISHNAVSNCLE